MLLKPGLPFCTVNDTEMSEEACLTLRARSLETMTSSLAWAAMKRALHSSSRAWLFSSRSSMPKSLLRHASTSAVDPRDKFNVVKSYNTEDIKQQMKKNNYQEIMILIWYWRKNYLWKCIHPQQASPSHHQGGTPAGWGLHPPWGALTRWCDAYSWPQYGVPSL